MTTRMDPDNLNNNDKELTQEKSEISSSNTTVYDSWTEEDFVCFLFIVNKVGGTHWKMIAENYKSHLKNKSEYYLKIKYWNLKQIKFCLRS